MTISDTSKKIRYITWVGLIINVLLSALKLFAGIFGKSQAVIADSIHSFSDVITDIAILLGARHWTSLPDKDHPYGHGRIETLVTVFIGLSLSVVALRIVYEALLTIKEVHAQPPGAIALIGALISIVFKEGLYQWTIFKAKKIRSKALIANAWHHRSDVLSSIPVAIAVGITRVRPDWSFLDHIGAIVVSAFIIKLAWNITKEALYELVDSTVSKEILAEIQIITQKHPKVKGVHAIRARNIGSGVHVDMHLLVDRSMTVFQGHEITEEVKTHLISSSLNIMDVVIHLEPYLDE